MPSPPTGRIDTHHHLFPPQWRDDHGQDILAAAPGMAASLMMDWTPQVSLEAMDKFGIGTSILSVATPGVWFGRVEESRSLARHCNDYGARLIADHPGRFGMFAAISFNDVEGSLREIAYALDVLKLDGVGLMTSCEDKWPGDPAFAAIFDELNRRKAIAYFHPTCPPFAANLIPEVSPSIGEFVFDTTRAVFSLLYSGTLSRCPDVKFIFSHGGGTVPYLADRIASLARRPNATALAARIPKGVAFELNKLYYDIVSVAGNPPGMKCLQGVAAPSRLLFGTDFPYYRAEHSVHGLAACELTPDERSAIDRGNALALFPRLAAG
jgi:predicted TIM-barrel fold metal-dependent hydrolase